MKRWPSSIEWKYDHVHVSIVDNDQGISIRLNSAFWGYSRTILNARVPSMLGYHPHGLATPPIGRASAHDRFIPEDHIHTEVLRPRLAANAVTMFR